MDPKGFIRLIIISFVLLFGLQCSRGDNGGGATPIQRRPLRADGRPVQVKMKGVILDIEDVNCVSMELTTELYIEHFWLDPSASGTRRPPANGGETGVWVPDTYIVNARKFNIRKQDITSNPRGEMERSEIITVTTKCSMDFSYYPFDHQRCHIELESYAFTTEDLQYNWSESEKNAVGIAANALSVLPFVVMDVKTHAVNVTDLNETYSRLTIDIHLRRHWNTYLETYYVPMTFFLSLSLLSLWMVYPRISAGVNFLNISLVNIFLQLYQGNSDLPKLYYKTAMTAYAIICYIFIFLTLLLNIYILYYIKTDEDDNENANAKRERAKNQEINQSQATNTRNIQSYVIKSAIPEEPEPEPSNWLVIKTRIMDKLRRNSHWTLLCAFLLTKLIYWITLLSIHYSE